VLSFGTAGCNLACRFCQNWDISKSRELDTLADAASPEAIAQAAQRLGCASVVFTYKDPVIFAEYAMDAADACHALGIKAVAVTAGYMNPRRGPTSTATWTPPTSTPRASPRPSTPISALRISRLYSTHCATSCGRPACGSRSRRS
jgi:hypothetical protein